MARYMLSAHSVDGEDHEPMSEDTVRLVVTQVRNLEEEMKSSGTWVLGGRLHAARHIGDFFRAELLAVLARDHAAQQLHDLDHGVLLTVLGWLRGVERRGVGVELERVQRRNALGLHLGDRGKARDQALIQHPDNWTLSPLRKHTTTNRC